MRILKYVTITLLFLAWGSLSFAASTYLDLIDTNNNGVVPLTISSINYTGSTYYFSITSPDHSIYYSTQTLSPATYIGSGSVIIPSYTNSVISLSPGLYDISLTDTTNTWYLSQGDSSYSITWNNKLLINNWNTIKVSNSLYTSDKLAVTPLPPTVWLFGTGLTILLLIKNKRYLYCQLGRYFPKTFSNS